MTTLSCGATHRPFFGIKTGRILFVHGLCYTLASAIKKDFG